MLANRQLGSLRRPCDYRLFDDQDAGRYRCPERDEDLDAQILAMETAGLPGAVRVSQPQVMPQKDVETLRTRWIIFIGDSMMGNHMRPLACALGANVRLGASKIPTYLDTATASGLLMERAPSEAGSAGRPLSLSLERILGITT